MINDKLQKIWYGGDYNPEQWDEATWAEDQRMFKLAGIDVATINVFSWALNQPDENTYDFSWLDETIDRLYQDGGVYLSSNKYSSTPPRMDGKTLSRCSPSRF